MKEETYVFKDMPKRIRENTDGARDRFIRGIVKDIAMEFEEGPAPEIKTWSIDEKGHNLHITFGLHKPFDNHYLWNLLNNTYGATPLIK